MPMTLTTRGKVVLIPLAILIVLFLMGLVGGIEQGTL